MRPGCRPSGVRSVFPKPNVLAEALATDPRIAFLSFIVIDGPINAESFLAYIEQVLVPTLRPVDVVIMDNLGSHKRQAIRRTIRAAGAKLFFLPPYSPDLNPIEQVFAKLKTLLRKAAERTIEATWRRIGSLLFAFSPAECAN